MATVTVHLDHGYKQGDTVHREITLRELTAGDIIDAQQEAERLVHTPDGPALVSSPTLVGLHTLRRQVSRIGDVSGPLSLAELKKLHPNDLYKLQLRAEELEGAAAADLASREVAQRGRDGEAPTGD
jgi:phage FluMu protein gp41